MSSSFNDTDSLSDIGSEEIKTFWHTKEYRKIVGRFEQAFGMATDLQALINERAEIERKYASHLSKWSSKWRQHITAGPEIASLETGYNALFDEALEIARVHRDMSEHLQSAVSSEIAAWQKEQFHKGTVLVNAIKEVKTLEGKFSQAQKPFSRFMKHFLKSRKECLAALKVLRNAERVVSDGTGCTEDQTRKLSMRLENAQREYKKGQSSYKSAYRQLECDVERYLQDMSHSYHEYEEFEHHRILAFSTYFKSTASILKTIDDCLDIKCVHSKMDHVIASIDADEDLATLRETRGIHMDFYFPYLNDDHDIEAPLVFKTVNIKPEKTLLKDDPPVIPSQSPLTPRENRNSTEKPSPLKSLTDYDESLNPFAMGEPDEEIEPQEDTLSDSNPFSESNESNSKLPESDTLENVKENKVIALYDYKGTEENELSFQKGDIILKLEEADDNNWAKGRVHEKEGFYPADYVSTL